MSEVDARFVKRGVWLDQARGPVMGRTLTTDIRTGTMLIAVLAVLASIAINHLWHLCLFAYHQYRANGRPADGLFWQQQTLLRASQPPSSFLADWVKIWWLWRGKAKHGLRRSLPHSLVAVVFTVATVAVGIFSSYAVDTADLPVLVNGPSCAPIDVDLAIANMVSQSLAFISGLANYRASTVRSRSEPLAAECYRNTTSLPGRCRAFIQPQIPLTYVPTGCPFDSSVCIDLKYPGVYVDSGLVSGDGFFGWNMAPKDQVKFRRKVACGVLRTEGHTETINGSDYPYWDRDPLPGERLEIIHYGNQRGYDFNHTFYYSLYIANLTRGYKGVIARDFLSEKWDKYSSEIDALPEMRSENADLAVVMVSKNQVRYGMPIDDPFFSAHRPVSSRDNDGNTNYLSDFPISIMGCNQQYQFCIARGDAPDYCTNLSGLPGHITLEEFPGASEIQIAALRLLVTASYLFDTSDAVESIVVAKKFGNIGFITSLPNDQWMREVLEWEKYIWASIQTVVSDYAIGYTALDPSTHDSIRTNLTNGEQQLCGAQRMKRSGGFMNINVFALAFIITFSCTVTILDLVLLKFLVFLGRFRRALAPRIDRWIQDGMFHAQRRALEAHGYGTWEGLEDEIPTTSNGEKLKELPLETPVPCRCTADPAPCVAWLTTDTELSLKDSKKELLGDHAFSSSDITYGRFAKSSSAVNSTPEDSSPSHSNLASPTSLLPSSRNDRFLH